MENARRLLDLWAWLPAFRAAAETEHLPTAAVKLHLTASAVSRSVRLLEEALGVKLFERTGRRLVLNQQGRGFLSEVRSAMRIVDDGIESLTGTVLRGTLRLSVPPDFSAWLTAPAMLALRTAHPELDLELLSLPESQVPYALHQGDLDAAVVSSIIETKSDGFDLLQEELVCLRYAVYARPAHALAGPRRPTSKILRDYVFAAAPGDGYPPLERERPIKTSDLRAAATLAMASELLVSLPTVIGEPFVQSGLLVQVSEELPIQSKLYLAYRRPVATHARTEALLRALRNVPTH